MGISEMAQWVRVLADKTDSLNVIPRTNTVKGENQFPQVSFDLNTCAARVHLHTWNK